MAAQAENGSIFIELVDNEDNFELETQVSNSTNNFTGIQDADPTSSNSEADHDQVYAISNAVSIVFIIIVVLVIFFWRRYQRNKVYTRGYIIYTCWYIYYMYACIKACTYASRDQFVLIHQKICTEKVKKVDKGGSFQVSRR